MSDPLGPLLDLPGVAQAVDTARAAVDQLLWDREVARNIEGVTRESVIHGAWANAWFDGAEAGLAELRDGAALDDSPIGRVLAGTVALHSELPQLMGIVGSAPAQALARMHTIVASGFLEDAALGRPRAGDTADDPLRLGPLPGAPEVADRLGALGQILVHSTAPGVLVAAITHAEVASLRPFAWGSGLVARALPRLVLAQRGVDPGMLGAPEVGLRAVGRPAYVRALRSYAQGSPEAVGELVKLLAQAVAIGAAQPSRWVQATA